MSMSAKIKQWMYFNNLSYRRAAVILGVDVRQVYRWATGENKPGIAWIERLDRILKENAEIK